MPKCYLLHALLFDTFRKKYNRERHYHFIIT